MLFFLLTSIFGRRGSSGLWQRFCLNNVTLNFSILVIHESYVFLCVLLHGMFSFLFLLSTILVFGLLISIAYFDHSAD